MNKLEIMKAILGEHRKLEDVLAVLKPNQMEISGGTDQWTVKETMVHISFWEQELMADYICLVSGETIHELEGEDEINALNAATRARGKSLPLEQVVSEFHESFRQLIDWLKKLPEEELDRPFAYGMSLGEFIGEDTWKHYSEHLSIFQNRCTK